MGRQIKAALYRAACSPVSLLILLVGVLFCAWAGKSADMKNVAELARELAGDTHALARLQNVFGVSGSTAAEIYEEYFRSANLILVYGLAHSGAYTFNIFLCAVFLGRDLFRLRLQPELLSCGRGRTLGARILLIQVLSALYHVLLFLYGARTYLVLGDHAPALLWGTLAGCILVTAANAAFLICIYTLFRHAVFGAVAAAAAEIVVMRLSLTVPISPARFFFNSFRSGGDAAALSAQMGPYLLWAAGYLVLFTALSFVLFRRKELR